MADNNSNPTLIGNWRLRSCHFEAADGQRSYPFGVAPVGLLTYGEDGWMSVQIMRENRPNFATGNQLNGSDAEVRAAFEGYNAYFGRYEINHDRREIVHRTVGNLYPNGIGSERVRTYTVDGNILTLTTPPMPFGAGQLKGILEWQRLNTTEDIRLTTESGETDE
jgi:hypothetical protein